MTNRTNPIRLPESRAAPVDLRGLLGVAPIAVYLGVRQLASAPLSIGAGLTVAVVVFALNRGRVGPATQMMSAFSLLAITGGAVAGIVLNSDKAFLANDFIGDFLMAALLMGSLLRGRPLAGAIAHELLPTVRAQVPRDDRVFVRLTLLYVMSNVSLGIYRLVLLQHVSPTQYLVYSRIVSVPVGLVMFAIALWMISGARRRYRQEPAPVQFPTDPTPTAEAA